MLIIAIGLPNVRALLSSDLINQNLEFSVDLSVICLVLGIIQFMFTASKVSISAISREGKNAVYMKFIPIDFYKQFIYKTRLQIIMNSILILIILILIKLIFPEFQFIIFIYFS